MEAHRDQLRSLAASHGFEEVRVFGSMARGDADDGSDVDLLVDLPPGKTGLALGALLHDAERLLGRRVDVVTRRSLNPMLRDRILRESRLV